MVLAGAVIRSLQGRDPFLRDYDGYRGYRYCRRRFCRGCSVCAPYYDGPGRPNVIQNFYPSSNNNPGPNYNPGPNFNQGQGYNGNPGFNQGPNYNGNPGYNQGPNYNPGYNQGPNFNAGQNYNGDPNYNPNYNGGQNFNPPPSYQQYATGQRGMEPSQSSRQMMDAPPYSNEKDAARNTNNPFDGGSNGRPGTR